MTATDDPRAKIAAGRFWAYAGVILGVGVSIAANVAHSYVPPVGPDGKPLFTGQALKEWAPQDGAIFGAVFWPLCLFVVLEIWSRNEWAQTVRSRLIRLGGLLPVGTVAAVVSYLHMSGLLDFYKEDPITVTIGPFAVDGLLVIATGALISTATHAASVRVPEPGSVTAAPSPVAVTEPARHLFAAPGHIDRAFAELDREQTRTAKREQKTMRRPDRAANAAAGQKPNRSRPAKTEQKPAVSVRADAELIEQVRTWCREQTPEQNPGQLSRYRIEQITGAAARQADRVLSALTEQNEEVRA